MHHVKIDQWAAELRMSDAPVLVGAPIGRSGTTALQRLINTDSSIVMYSEDDFLFDQTLLTIQATGWLSDHSERLAADRERVRENDWHIAVVPEPATYAAVHYNNFFRLAGCYRRDAASLGASRWGMRRPNRALRDFVLFSRLMPQTRIVYIVRDIADCLRSYKAYDKGRHIAAACDMWVRNMRSWQANKGACLTVDFARLEADPASVAAELSEYLSLDLDASILNKRVNAPSRYQAPGALTDEEQRLVERARQEFRSHA